MATFRPYVLAAAAFALGIAAVCLLSDSVWGWMQSSEAFVFAPKMLAVLLWGKMPLLSLFVGVFLQWFVVVLLALLPFWVLNRRGAKDAT